MRRGMRRLGLVAATTLVASATASCTPFACTTIGYSSTLDVALAEPRDDVALELCLTEGCTPMTLDELAGDAAIAAGVWAEASGDGRDGWTLVVSGGGDVVGYRVLAADGAVLAEGEAHPDWVRVGGSEQCGGPAEATIVLG